jgi:hypothetical protein
MQGCDGARAARATSCSRSTADGNKTLYSDKIASWGRASEAVNKLGALSKRGAPYFAIGVDKLDADKMKINVNNGTLVVARKSDGDYVSFQPHDPADLITKISPVDYRSRARSARTTTSSSPGCSRGGDADLPASMARPVADRRRLRTEAGVSLRQGHRTASRC